ncbi:MAG TPA: class I fructose-bisphosphate aldolase [Candidatus Dormibacteraeota bacterium]|nr:class I fructose-bisphosphate aldolase [Candidatus Dormibacteraeota bacterium]
MMLGLATTARAMVADSKGILAADESTGTIAKRFASLGVESTEETRLDYRQILVGAPGLSEFISAVILYDETLRQQMPDRTPIATFLAAQGMIPGIKVDRGLVPLAPSSVEQVTEGLDRLAARLVEYRELGAQFAKWRAVLHVGPGLPSAAAIEVNAWLLGRYARVCQDGGLVPIVEPEVLMNGAHSLEDCASATSRTLTAVFSELRAHGVSLAGTVLKTNMVTPGSAIFASASPAEVARRTVEVLRAHVPADVPGVAFLSGGQSEEAATANLDEIARLGQHPWRICFSFGRALQESALRAWGGRHENAEAAQLALLERARANSHVLRRALSVRT